MFSVTVGGERVRECGYTVHCMFGCRSQIHISTDLFRFLVHLGTSDSENIVTLMSLQ